MENVLFLQSEVSDPYEIYAKMLAEHSLYFDRTNNLWAVYSYDDCCLVLNNSAAQIPGHTRAFTTESEVVRKVIRNLARLNNPPHHVEARKVASTLMMQWRTIEVSQLIHFLLGEPKRPAIIDWVDVSKKLPVLMLMKGFNFSSQVIDLVLGEMDTLVKIMLPSRSAEQNYSVNRTVDEVFDLFCKHVIRICTVKNEEDIQLHSANLMGLLIQSYDAGRGLLSNALLQMIRDKDLGKEINHPERSVRETLRFDPPVQNTRRVLTESVTIQHQHLSVGSNVLVVIAAANRDPDRFKNPDKYDIFRRENPQYLTFGEGAHRCLAEHLSIRMTGSVLGYIFYKYKNITVLQSEIRYEPRINVRLAQEIHLEVS